MKQGNVQPVFSCQHNILIMSKKGQIFSINMHLFSWIFLPALCVLILLIKILDYINTRTYSWWISLGYTKALILFLIPLCYIELFAWRRTAVYENVLCSPPPHQHINPFMPTVAFNICCPRDCVSRHNGGTSGATLKPLRDDSTLIALSPLRGLRGAPEVPPLCRETSVSRTANVERNGGHEWVNILECKLEKLHRAAVILESLGIIGGMS